MSDTAVAEAPRLKNAPPKGRETVTVACKLANGLVLHLDEPRQVQEQTLNGSREITQWFRIEEQYTLVGSAMSHEQMMSGDTRATIIGGYALTSGIPADFWAKWLEQNSHTPIVRREFVFAHRQEDSVRDFAREHAKLRTGMEPVDPDNPASASPEFSRVKKQLRDEDDGEEAGI